MAVDVQVEVALGQGHDVRPADLRPATDGLLAGRTVRREQLGALAIGRADHLDHFEAGQTGTGWAARPFQPGGALGASRTHGTGEAIGTLLALGAGWTCGTLCAGRAGRTGWADCPSLALRPRWTGGTRWAGRADCPCWTWRACWAGRTGWADGPSLTLRTLGSDLTRGAHHVPADVGLVLLALVARIHYSQGAVAGPVARLDLVGLVAGGEGAGGQVGHEKEPEDCQRSDRRAALECSRKRCHDQHHLP